MKKQYINPNASLIHIETSCILAASNPTGVSGGTSTDVITTGYADSKSSDLWLFGEEE